jgi:hypothetical protein
MNTAEEKKLLEQVILSDKKLQRIMKEIDHLQRVKDVLNIVSSTIVLFLIGLCVLSFILK